MCSAVITSRLPVAVMKMSAVDDDVVEREHLVAVHRRLQRADRVDLGDDDARALAAQRLRAALADVAVAADDRDLAADQHVGGAVDPVDQRVAAAVLVVELRLRDGVVDVDRREQQLALLGELVQAMHAGRRLLGDALDLRRDLRPPLRVLLERALAAARARSGTPRSRRVAGSGTAPARSNSTPLWTSSVASPPSSRIMFGPGPSRRPRQRLLGAPPVLLERLALPGVHRHAARVLGGPVRADHDRRGGVVLGREDVARRPADLGAERHQRLDQHRRLDRHVQRARDPRAARAAARRRTRAASPSAPASRARRGGSRCARTRPAPGRPP